MGWQTWPSGSVVSSRPCSPTWGWISTTSSTTGGTLRVTVDRQGGVDLEAIASATRMISRELDHADPLPGRYTLEVSSPGLERPLRTPEHFQRAVGDTLAVRTQPDVDGDRRVQGVLAAADDDGDHRRIERRTRPGRASPGLRTRSSGPAPCSRGAPTPSKPGQPQRKAAS